MDICDIFGKDQIFIYEAKIVRQKHLVMGEFSKVISLKEHSKYFEVIVEMLLSNLFALRWVCAIFEETQEVFNCEIHHDVVLRFQLNLINLW